MLWPVQVESDVNQLLWTLGLAVEYIITGHRYSIFFQFGPHEHLIKLFCLNLNTLYRMNYWAEIKTSHRVLC